jgi:two-component system response regulator (stage 0 sporulation protein A)
MEVLHERVLNFLDEQPEEHEQVQIPETGIDHQLSSLLMKIGIPPQNKGFRYISEAAKLVMAKPELANSLTKKLYPGIGEIYHAGANNVERGIRHAIEVAWNSGKLENINKITDCELIDLKYKPTNGEFISIVHQLLSHSA